MSATEVRLSGKVSWFDPGKGYGFIARDDGEKDVFVHYSQILSDKYKNLADGQEVEFELRSDAKGISTYNVKAVGTILKCSPRPPRQYDR